MLNRIKQSHLPIPSERPEITATQAEPKKDAAAQVLLRYREAFQPETQPDPWGVELMKEKHGEVFTHHYYRAWSAAGKVRGDEFLVHYRTLKHCAKQQGMSEAEFRGFERCLYRHFYRAATRDCIRRRQEGRELKVDARELAYLAKVGEISTSQLSRDALAFRRSDTVGEMRAIRGRLS